MDACLLMMILLLLLLLMEDEGTAREVEQVESSWGTCTLATLCRASLTPGRRPSSPLTNRTRPSTLSTHVLLIVLCSSLPCPY